jgi:membrane fusion protein, multidrug efflux system
MRKTVIVVVAAAALCGLAGLAFYFGVRPASEEPEVETEVAVRVAQITRATLHEYVTAYGVVEPAPPGATPGGSARINPAVPGIVTVVTCAEGQSVRRGTVLFQLDSRLADASADKARSAVRVAEATLERQQKLIQAGGTSRKALLEAEQALASARSDLSGAQTQQALLRVEAPIAGIVAHIGARLGEAVDMNTTLAELVDPDRLVVNATVPSAELAAVRVGQAAEVVADTSATPMPAVIEFVSPQIEARTGAAVVRAAPRAREGLRPGQLVALRIVTAEHKERLVVPVESVVKDREGATVIALVRDGRALHKAVETGMRDGDLIEIRAEGLTAGMSIVTEGAYGLPKETKVRVLNP